VHSSVGASRWGRDAPLDWTCEYLDNEAGRTHPARKQGIYRTGVLSPKSLNDVTTGGNEKESLSHLLANARPDRFSV
jgi:hypothetical protein